MEAKVLIVEDDLALRPFWEVFLRRQFENVEIDWAVSGEQAQDQFVNSLALGHRYSLIIVDLFLAGSMTGLDLVSFFSQFDSAPILLASSSDSDCLQMQLSQSQSNVYVLDKPLSIPKCERLLGRMGQSVFG